MIEISVTRRLEFNTGRYEKQVVHVTISGIPADEYYPEDVARQLDEWCLPDIERAALATTHDPADNDTSIHVWKDIVNATTKEGADA